MTQEAIKVLIVEDDPLFTKLVSTMLATKNYEVFAAASAEEGIEALKSQSFDVLITDLKMEGIGGVGLIRWVTAEASLPLTRVLVITGEPQNSEDSNWVRSQSISILRKPFALRALLDEMERLLQA
jgi:two-component system response regulator FlrC